MAPQTKEALQKILWAMLMKLLSCLHLQVLLQLLCQVNTVCVLVTKVAHTSGTIVVCTAHYVRL